MLVPAFWELFSGEAPAADESLCFGRVAILFTDLRGSTAMYVQRGGPHIGWCAITSRFLLTRLIEITVLW